MANHFAVAWLHELFEYTAITEEELLAEGLSLDDLRALRLVSRNKDSRSKSSYLAHVKLIAGATGPGARVVRSVKRADLADRANHPVIRAGGWSPPYELGLEILRKASTAAPRGDRTRWAHPRRGNRRRHCDILVALGRRLVEASLLGPPASKPHRRVATTTVAITSESATSAPSATTPLIPVDWRTWSA